MTEQRRLAAILTSGAKEPHRFEAFRVKVAGGHRIHSSRAMMSPEE